MVRSRGAVRGGLAGVGALALVLGARDARAQEPKEATPDDSAFQYTTRGEPHYIRAALEVGLVLGLGSLQYGMEQGNSTDWDLNYDWPSFRSKLTGDGVSFDTNRFDTNMLTHPVSGLLYYWAARGNRLPIYTAALYSFAGSTLWEYVGELREKVSINDMIVTPLAGVSVGESFAQLGGYFDRGRKNVLTGSLAWLFGAPKRLHDAIDGDIPAESDDTDALGFSRAAGHAFELGAGGGATRQSTSKVIYGDARFRLRTHLVNIPEYNYPTRASRFFHDGNVSTIEADTTVSSAGLTDLWLNAEVAPLGWYEQSFVEGPDHALVGSRWFIGMTVGFDYALHDYDRTEPTSLDQISTVYAAGVRLEHARTFPSGFQVRTNLDVHPSFGAVRSLAIDDYFVHATSLASLPTVVREESYYYAWGATVGGEVEARYRGLRLGGSGRVDGFTSIDGFDRYPDRVSHVESLHDRRASLRGWTGLALYGPLEVSVELVKRFRDGAVASAFTHREELSLSSLASVVF